MYGTILALFGAASLSLGIANVVLTKEAYCNPWMEDANTWCSSTKEPYIWTWVAPGIWGSVPIFLAGLFGMCLSSHPQGWSRMFALFVFVSAIVFAPGMTVLSSIECWRGSASEYNFYMHHDGVKQGNIWTPDHDDPYQAKFALPLVIAILGGIEFLMTALVTLQFCCCGETLGIYMDSEVNVISAGPRIVPPVPIAAQEVYYPSRPQVDVYRPAVYQPPVRYNPVGTGVNYGQFPSRTGFGGYIGAGINTAFGGNRPGVGAGFGAGIYGSNPSYRWY
jgi:hypothetical protein